mgnify:CR=1 FL=1
MIDNFDEDEVFRVSQVVDVQEPIATDGDSVYVKDIDTVYSDTTGADNYYNIKLDYYVHPGV